MAHVRLPGGSKPARPAGGHRSARLRVPTDAYAIAVGLLARRELSERQVRQRLARRGFDEPAIEAAVARLAETGALDDKRVADAIAHTAVTIKRRGRLRVRQQIEQAGIAPAVARATVDELFGELDEDALLEAALARKLKGAGATPGAPDVTNQAEFARLYRFLVGQGFEPDRVVRLLERRRRHPSRHPFPHESRR